MSKLKHYNLISIIVNKADKKRKITALVVSKEIKSIFTKATDLTGANDRKIQPDGKINVTPHLSRPVHLIQVYLIVLNNLGAKKQHIQK